MFEGEKIKCVECGKEMTKEDLIWCFVNRETGEHMHFECYAKLIGKTMGELLLKCDKK
jgi:hypothetical protein